MLWSVCAGRTATGKDRMEPTGTSVCRMLWEEYGLPLLPLVKQ